MEKSSWLDISLPLKNGLPPWPGDRLFERRVVKEIGPDSEYCLSALTMSSHTGTHMDAPKHFVPGGAGLDELDPELLIGPAYVLDLSDRVEHITAADLAGKAPEGAIRLLIKTRNSACAGDGVFHEDFLALAVDAAQFLAGHGVRLLGIDAYSIAPFDAPVGAHRAFLSVPGAAVLENIDLSRAQEGWYDLVCLPLPVAGGDGAPARALIRKRGVRP